MIVEPGKTPRLFCDEIVTKKVTAMSPAGDILYSSY